jgi:hypothetical protein
MKKILIALLAVTALSGCASRTGTAALIGGTVGYIIAKEVHEERHHRAPVVVREVVVHPGPCDHYTVYSERRACERGVKQRMAEEQRRRDNEAYRSGYGR